MEFVADESIDRQIVDQLRADSHDVWYVAEMEPGISDSTVFDIANEKGAVLVTADKDFGELVYRQGRLTAGIVLVRLAGLSPWDKAETVVNAIRMHGHAFSQTFTVVTARTVRVRRTR